MVLKQKRDIRRDWTYRIFSHSLNKSAAFGTEIFRQSISISTKLMLCLKTILKFVLVHHDNKFQNRIPGASIYT